MAPFPAEKNPQQDPVVTIGRIALPGRTLPYPMSRRDIESDTEWALGLLRSMAIHDRQLVLFVSGGAETVQMWPYQNAAMRLGAPQAFAENSPYDAYRVEMFLRRFPLQLAFGVTRAVLQGLSDAGHEPGAVFARAGHVVAHADAWRELRDAGVPAWRLISLGPTYAIEPPEGGGASYDRREWLAEESNGEILLSSLAPRACPLAALQTGVKGTVARHGDERRIELAN
jgi:hypothetical protein